VQAARNQRSWNETRVASAFGIRYLIVLGPLRLFVAAADCNGVELRRAGLIWRPWS
jgi:hypothetical protein